MCNLYSTTTNQATIIALKRKRKRVGDEGWVSSEQR
jgi:hypothetical protein